MNIGTTVTFVPGAAGLGSFWAPIRTTSLVTFESDDHAVACTHAVEMASALRAFVTLGGRQP